jgi:hypothetical protein
MNKKKIKLINFINVPSKVFNCLGCDENKTLILLGARGLGKHTLLKVVLCPFRLLVVRK